MIAIEGAKSLTIPTAMGGDDQTYGLVVVAVTRGLIVKELASGNVQIEGFTDLDLLSTTVVAGLVAKSAEVYGYPVYFELDDATALTPAGLPESTDDQGAQVAWQDWGAPWQQCIQIGSKWYRSNNVGQSGEKMLASQWVPWLSSPPAGLRVIAMAEFQAISDQAGS